MEKRTLIIGGGVAAVGVLALLYMRSRAPAREEGDDVLSGGTLLFTPPAPLAAPGSGDWSGGNAYPVTGGSTSLGDALLEQDRNATELGKATLLSQLTANVISLFAEENTVPAGFRFGATLTPTEGGGFAIDSQLLRGRNYITGRISDEDIGAYERIARLPGVSQTDLERLQDQLFFARTGEASAPWFPGDASPPLAPSAVPIAGSSADQWASGALQFQSAPAGVLRTAKAPKVREPRVR